MCVLYHSSVCWEIWFHSIQLLVTQILSVSWLWNPKQWTSNLSVKAEIMESHEDAFLTICWNSIDSLLTYRHNQNSIKKPKTNQKVALKIWSLGCQENVFDNHEEQNFARTYPSNMEPLCIISFFWYVLFLLHMKTINGLSRKGESPQVYPAKSSITDLQCAIHCPFHKLSTWIVYLSALYSKIITDFYNLVLWKQQDRVPHNSNTCLENTESYYPGSKRLYCPPQSHAQLPGSPSENFFAYHFVVDI